MGYVDPQPSQPSSCTSARPVASASRNCDAGV